MKAITFNGVSGVNGVTGVSEVNGFLWSYGVMGNIRIFGISGVNGVMQGRWGQ